MKYKCKTIDISKLPISTVGTITPLCSDCKTSDCSHNIQLTSISVFGILYKNKVLIRGGEPNFVIQCEGYSNE